MATLSQCSRIFEYPENISIYHISSYFIPLCVTSNEEVVIYVAIFTCT